MWVWTWNKIDTLTIKDLQTGHIEWKEHPSGIRWAGQAHCARRRARMEETEENSGKMSADPKQKTQPDGDQELCQFGLCCDACRVLCCSDGDGAKVFFFFFFKERWKKRDIEG